MRQRALTMGYTLNEHGLHNYVNKRRGDKVIGDFNTERDIFNFLHMKYRTPQERQDGRSVIILKDDISLPVKAASTTKTLKRRKLKKVPVTLEIVDISPEVGDNKVIDLLKAFKQNGITVLELVSEKELMDMIKKCNELYYNHTPMLTDSQFDIMKDFAESKFPNNIVIHEIGARVEKNKVNLPYVMASMDKIKPDTEALNKWVKKYGGPYVISCKLDGVSALYTTEGINPQLFTRGNGIVGQNISHLIPYLQLPSDKNGVIRGELIIPKKIFDDKYSVKFSNPRNLVAGIVNHKTINENVRDVRFVGYEIIMPHISPSHQMTLLSSMNIECVQYKIINILTNDKLSEILIEWRREYEYEIDGIIVTNDKIYDRVSGNPEHSFAFKMVLSDQVVEVKVVDVIWTASKDGYLKPRVRIEPVRLGGVTIDHATGFNASFIQKHKIGIGAVVKLIRSGDVIPHIRSVVVPAEHAKMPNIPYKWNATNVDIVLENIDDDETVRAKNISRFFSWLNIDGMGPGNVNILIINGYTSVEEILNMSETNFTDISRFKGKMGPKLYNGIQLAVKNASIPTLMTASSIFGRGFSDKKSELIMNMLPDILISTESNDVKIERISHLKGMTLKSAELFVDKIDAFIQFLKNSKLEYKLREVPTPAHHLYDENHALFNKRVVLTGSRDKIVSALIIENGGLVGDKVNNSTFMVVAKDVSSTSGTIMEARRLGIPIISIETFVEKYNA